LHKKKIKQTKKSHNPLSFFYLKVQQKRNKNFEQKNKKYKFEKK